jgi:hypothetical protein
VSVRRALALTVLVLLGRGPSIASASMPLPPVAVDASFSPAMRALEADYLRLLETVDPVGSTLLGLHGGDGTLGPAGFAGRDSVRIALQAFQDRVEALEDSLYSADDRYDAALMLFDLRRRRFEADSLRVRSRDPGAAIRTVASGLSGLLDGDPGTLRERARNLVARENEVPAYLEAALAMVQNPPRVLVDQALTEADGLSTFLIDRIPAAIPDLADTALTDSLAAATTAALQAVWNYRRSLSEEVLPHAMSDAALGPGLFAGYLRAEEGVGTPLPRLRAQAEAELARLDARFRATAFRIDSTLTPGEVMARVANDHPEPGEILPFTETAIAGARKFVAGDGAVPVPKGPHVLVRPSPVYSRWINASLAAPPPFRSGDRAGVFYVTLPDPTATPEVREEQLRFLNRSLIRNLAVHETWPGHYLQALISNRLDRPVRRAIQCGAFVEGWAHYTESLMVERGYRSDDLGYRLATLQSALRRAARFRVALGLQTEGWTVDEAARFLEGRAYLEPAIARREAVRGTFDPLYLVYTLGKLEIEALRAACRRSEGMDFDLERFHARLLDLGAPPLPLARNMMLRGDPAGGHWLD